MIDFARKTGDYTQLSVPDLKVLALTYMIEREQNGLSNIRVEPPLRAAEQAAAKAAKAKAAAAAKAGSAAAAGANANPGMSKKAAARAARLSRTLAWILRHGADDLELGADAQGFVAVEKLLEVEQLRTRKPRTTAQHIRDAVHHAGSAGMFTLVRVAIKSPSTAAESAAEGATTEEATPAAGGAGVGAAPPLPPTSAPKPARAFGARRKKTAVATRLMIRATGGHTLAAVVAAAPAAAAAAAAAAPSAEAPTGSAPVVAAAAAASAARRASKDAAASAAPVAAAAAAAATTKKKKNTLTSRIFGADGSMGQSTVLESAADDEDGDWVNPGNFDGVSIGVGVGGSTGSSMFAGSAACALTTVKAERGAGASGSGAAGAPPRVGCITTDFAMQNVILQMNLKLVALNGSVITRCKQWLLRCDACFFIVKPDANAALTGDRHRSAAAQNQALADSLFCPKCGSAALNRVAYSTDATGRTKLHLRKNRRIAVRRPALARELAPPRATPSALRLRPPACLATCLRCILAAHSPTHAPAVFTEPLVLPLRATRADERHAVLHPEAPRRPRPRPAAARGSAPHRCVEAARLDSPDGAQCVRVAHHRRAWHVRWHRAGGGEGGLRPQQPERAARPGAPGEEEGEQRSDEPPQQESGREAFALLLSAVALWGQRRRRGRRRRLCSTVLSYRRERSEHREATPMRRSLAAAPTAWRCGCGFIRMIILVQYTSWNSY